MKTYKQFVSEAKEAATMSDTQIIKWLDKTADSLSSHARKGSANSARGYDLRDRYDDLKDEAIKRKIWHKWCDGRGYDKNNCGIDFYA